MIVINGKSESQLSILDRGFQYGDGVFETIAYRNGQAEFIHQHLQRLQLGCDLLRINSANIQLLHDELVIMLEQVNEPSVIKLIVTRGQGNRGYFSDNKAMPTRIIMCFPYPVFPDEYQTEGIYVRFCEQRLSTNQRLAGIKHLNRLEQVIARNEWDDSDIAEGLMSDHDDNIIEGTMSNLFIVKSGKLYTPDIARAGIAGVTRAKIIELATCSGLPVEEKIINRKELADAEEVFICNSIIGIWPVYAISNKLYAIGFITKFLQKALSECHKV